MYIDTHAHLDFDAFDEDRDAVIQRAIENDLIAIITIGTSVETSRKAVELAESYAPIFAAVGIHPSDCQEATEADYHEIEKLSRHEKVVAIGEIGLDYYKMYTEKPTQMAAFKRQIALARSVNLPIIVHNREAHEDVYQTLIKEKATEVGGVLHSFSGDADFLKRVLETNFFISFTGGVTFKNTRGADELVKQTPVERLLLETDSPFITPAPHRGKRNEPSFVVFTARKIAELKELPVTELAARTTDNAKHLFALNV
ncbi:MAG: TatD family deoxyribonuclease [Calditrichaeota bacterium]|nr:MAG: TatD family deoxyribonuclease [Calditrichota bacterium]